MPVTESNSKSTGSDQKDSAPSSPAEILPPRDELEKELNGCEKRTSAYVRAFDRLCRWSERQFVLDLLKDQYQLNLFDVIGVIGQPQRIVQERQKLYHAHLDRLKAQWAKEDAEGERGLSD